MNDLFFLPKPLVGFSNIKDITFESSLNEN